MKIADDSFGQMVELLFEKTSQGVVYQDASGRIIGANKSADRILGLTADRLSGETQAELGRRAVAEDGSDLSSDALPAAQVLETQQPVLNFKQGIFDPKLKSVVWVSVDAFPGFSPETGQLTHILSIYTDITGQKVAEESERMALDKIKRLLVDAKRTGRALMSVVEDLKSSEAALRGLNERLQYLVHAVKGLTASRTIEEIQENLVASARHLVDADGASLIFREDDFCHYVAENAISPLWKGQKFNMDECVSGWVIKHDTPAVIPDIYSDDRVPIRYYSSTPIKSLAMLPIIIDRPIGAIGVYWHARHELSKMETSLLQTLADSAAMSIENTRLLRDLEKRVQERTADYEAANKELESFSYSVSHDLRTPLRAIDGYARILHEDYFDALDFDGKRICETISANTEKMGRLIDDLLLFSRTGKVPIVKRHIDMSSLVRQVVDETTQATEQGKYEIDIGELPPALGDPSLMRQVWVNLIGNAVKFSRKVEHPRIAIGAERTSNDIVYTVDDNGAGFNMEYSDKLFGVFQRLHGQNEFEGTGVGLAIVQRIINRHGGRIWAEGAPGKGARFHFSLKREETNGR